MMPWTFLSLNVFAQFSAVALSPLPSQNTRSTPARSACALMPSEIECTIGTDSLLER